MSINKDNLSKLDSIEKLFSKIKGIVSYGTMDDVEEEKILSNIEELGNTGSVSSALVFAQNDSIYKEGDLIVLTVFGGGYSAGSCLIKC